MTMTTMNMRRWCPLALASFLLLFQNVAAVSSIVVENRRKHSKILTTTTIHHDIPLLTTRGGAKKKRGEDPFLLVAHAIQDRLSEEFLSDNPPEVEDIVDAFVQLSSSQQTFKGLDGAAHEAYQRTHAGDDVDLSVRGRARRSAARAAATADGLGACELCELLEVSELDLEEESVNGTLVGRQVLLNLTSEESTIQLGGSAKNKVSVVVLYESVYTGGAGLRHGGIEQDDNKAGKKAAATRKGRLLVIVGDPLRKDLTQSLQLLDQPAKHVRLGTGLLSGEVASVQPSLYKAAGTLLETLEPLLRQYDNTTSAIHFVGRSLAGGIANLAAIMLDGSLPLPKDSKKKKNKKSKKRRPETYADDDLALPENATDTNVTTPTIQPLSGLGKDRTSCVSLGAPPCVSANVQSEFIISILYGDDILCRASRASIDRLLERSKKAIKSKGWFGGKQLNLMSDAFSLTMSSLKSHAHGSEGEELRLATPGRAYLLRPRRLGDASSIHEVGNRLKGGREALRAHILWQLDDVLLSKSLWKHHQLDSYIHGLDRAHLRGFTDDGDGDYDYE